MSTWRARIGVRWPDVAVAAVVIAVIALGMPHVEAERVGERSPDVIAYACGFAAAASLAFSRRFGVAMVAVVAAALAVYYARYYVGGPALLPGPLSLFLLGFRDRRRPVVLGLTAGVAPVVVGASWIGAGQVDFRALVATGWTFAAAFAGILVAARGERAAAERERHALRQRQAVADERLRIARDLHDSVAHAMATINVQSGVAAHLLEQDADGAGALATTREALGAIRTASGEVLEELGAMLDTLRQDGGSAPLAPVAGLDRIDELVERARNDGLRVECTVEGDAATVSPAVGAAAYRVVQEALINTRRHAGEDTTAHVEVTVGADGPGTVRVEVLDDGGRRSASDVAGTAPSTGLGLVGMRERVESTGGELATGRRPGAGYRVFAIWPQGASR